MDQIEPDSLVHTPSLSCITLHAPSRILVPLPSPQATVWPSAARPFRQRSSSPAGEESKRRLAIVGPSHEQDQHIQASAEGGQEGLSEARSCRLQEGRSAFVPEWKAADASEDTSRRPSQQPQRREPAALVPPSSPSSAAAAPPGWDRFGAPSLAPEFICIAKPCLGPSWLPSLSVR